MKTHIPFASKSVYSTSFTDLHFWCCGYNLPDRAISTEAEMPKRKKKCFQRKAKEIQGCCECFSLSPDLTAVFLMSGIKDFNLTATVFFDYLLRIRVRIILYTFISHNMLGKKIIRTRCDFMCVWELLSHILNH